MRRKQYILYTRKYDKLPNFMIDVIIATIPLLIMAIVKYGFAPLIVIFTSVVSAIIGDILFSKMFFKRSEVFYEYSSIVTGIVFALTLPPYTPFWIVAFGSISGVIFGKLMFRGMERNIFNPALVGRAVITAFYPVTMVSNEVWRNAGVIASNKNIVSELINKLLMNNFGAIGDYSPVLLIISGVYLIFRKRIHWYSPVCLCIVSIFGLFFAKMLGKDVYFSLGGLLVIGIFIISDIITTPYTPSGKIYFSIMTGVLGIIFCFFNIKTENFYYAVLILNAFVPIINEVFKPKIFGEVLNLDERLVKGSVLTALILAVTIVVGILSIFGLLKYLISLYIVGVAIRLIKSGRII